MASLQKQEKYKVQYIVYRLKGKSQSSSQSTTSDMIKNLVINKDILLFSDKERKYFDNLNFTDTYIYFIQGKDLLYFLKVKTQSYEKIDSFIERLEIDDEDTTRSQFIPSNPYGDSNKLGNKSTIVQNLRKALKSQKFPQYFCQIQTILQFAKTSKKSLGSEFKFLFEQSDKNIQKIKEFYGHKLRDIVSYPEALKKQVSSEPTDYIMSKKTQKQKAGSKQRASQSSQSQSQSGSSDSSDQSSDNSSSQSERDERRRKKSKGEALKDKKEQKFGKKDKNKNQKRNKQERDKGKRDKSRDKSKDKRSKDRGDNKKLQKEKKFSKYDKPSRDQGRDRREKQKRSRSRSKKKQSQRDRNEKKSYYSKEKGKQEIKKEETKKDKRQTQSLKKIDSKLQDQSLKEKVKNQEQKQKINTIVSTPKTDEGSKKKILQEISMQIEKSKKPPIPNPNTKVQSKQEPKKQKKDQSSEIQSILLNKNKIPIEERFSKY